MTLIVEDLEPLDEDVWRAFRLLLQRTKWKHADHPMAWSLPEHEGHWAARPQPNSAGRWARAKWNQIVEATL